MKQITCDCCGKGIKEGFLCYHYEIDITTSKLNVTRHFDFCPECGAKVVSNLSNMRAADERNDTTHEFVNRDL